MNEEINVTEEEMKAMEEFLEENAEPTKWEKFKDWLFKPRVSAKDLLTVVAPVCALAGVAITANEKLEEAKLNNEHDLEIEKLKAETAIKVEVVKQSGAIRCEEVRAKSRLDQLDKICASSDEQLPDSFSLKLMNENNKG